MAQVKTCSVRFVAAGLGVSEPEIMQAIKDERLMATGGRSPAKAKVYVADVVTLFKVDVFEVFGLKKETKS